MEKCPKFFIGKDPIKEVKSLNFFGNYIDTRIKHNAQIKYFKSKISQLCGMSFRLRNCLKFQDAKNLYDLCMYSMIAQANKFSLFQRFFDKL